MEATSEGIRCEGMNKAYFSTAVVTFNYIFSSCYVLEVGAGNVSDFMNIFNYSESKYIDTDYKKDLLIDKKPRIITQHIPALQELQFSVSYVTGINVAGMDLEIRYRDSYLSTCGEGSKQHWWEMALSFQSIEGFEDLHIGLRLNSDIDQTMDRACYVSGHEHSCCTYRTSGQFMCQMKHHLSNKPSCRVESDGIKCTIHNVTTGNYCVMVEMIDDRCERGTVWNNNSYCVYNSEIIKVEPTSPPEAEPPPSPAAFDAILVAVVLAIVLMCVCLLVFFCRRRRRRSLDSGGTCHVGEVTVPRRPRILLLYARDCEPFMNMMVTLRQVLKEVTMCEVYDCFDPVSTEELCQNKTDWLRTHVSSPDVKVVLVENRCAVLQQRALMEHMKVIYKDPTWLDDLFLYGLRVLLEDLQTNVYERVFVVRIHGFTEEDDNLCHITPYTRYVIPQNTEKLLSSLYQESALEHIIILEDGDSSVQRLQDDIRMLQVFKQQNGDYLSNLLEMVTKQCVEKTELEV
ncbi:hypothetical protein Cfor_07171 [Coptotermes formosanus]|uniref:SEFIR domain-containing protein n=1 Tax=Coptotermes formosanus TaxID=36987 RepID=A0A6L2Q3V8_COPFO|nr:hypothetical protein Cfor_07171 [Coptotermes formosanus]